MMRYVILLLAASLPLLNGCAPLIVGGAAATGVLVAEDRRTVGILTEDQTIESRTSSRLGDGLKGNVHINVTSYNRAVLLTGEVPDAASKQEAERITRAVDNVKTVYNELAIHTVTPISSRTADTITTSKVKARFVDAQKFSPVHVKVVTEAGVVYLMGLVKKQEAQDATEIARTTSDVRRVVRIFEYVD